MKTLSNYKMLRVKEIDGLYNALYPCVQIPDDKRFKSWYAHVMLAVHTGYEIVEKFFVEDGRWSPRYLKEGDVIVAGVEDEKKVMNVSRYYVVLDTMEDQIILLSPQKDEYNYLGFSTVRSAIKAYSLYCETQKSNVAEGNV